MVAALHLHVFQMDILDPRQQPPKSLRISGASGVDKVGRVKIETQACRGQVAQQSQDGLLRIHPPAAFILNTEYQATPSGLQTHGSQMIEDLAVRSGIVIR